LARETMNGVCKVNKIYKKKFFRELLFLRMEGGVK